MPRFIIFLLLFLMVATATEAGRGGPRNRGGAVREKRSVTGNEPSNDHGSKERRHNGSVAALFSPICSPQLVGAFRGSGIKLSVGFEVESYGPYYDDAESTEETAEDSADVANSTERVGVPYVYNHNPVWVGQRAGWDDPVPEPNNSFPEDAEFDTCEALQLGIEEFMEEFPEGRIRVYYSFQFPNRSTGLDDLFNGDVEDSEAPDEPPDRGRGLVSVQNKTKASVYPPSGYYGGEFVETTHFSLTLIMGILVLPILVYISITIQLCLLSAFIRRRDQERRVNQQIFKQGLMMV